MTREQSIKWVQKRLRESGNGPAMFWGMMAFFWGVICLIHLYYIGEFKYESVIVAMLFLSVANLTRILQMRKCERVLGVLFRESWQQVCCQPPNTSSTANQSPAPPTEAPHGN
jgi:hypothetical protein